MIYIQAFFYFIVGAFILKAILLIIELAQYMGIGLFFASIVAIVWAIVWILGKLETKPTTSGGYSIDNRTTRQRTHDEYHAAKRNASNSIETMSEYDNRKRLQQKVRDSY